MNNPTNGDAYARAKPKQRHVATFDTSTLRTETDRLTGRSLVLVPLSNSDKPARVDQEDWLLLGELGVSPLWTFNEVCPGSFYVRTRFLREGDDSSNNHQVSRLITGARRGQVVRHRDGDRRNLTRWNLILEGRRKAAQSENPAQLTHGFARATDKTSKILARRRAKLPSTLAAAEQAAKVNEALGRLRERVEELAALGIHPRKTASTAQA
jgi:hypothetical protein